jgi:hypothetical protein
VTDSAGLTSTSTRTVIIEAAPSIVPAYGTEEDHPQGNRRDARACRQAYGDQGRHRGSSRKFEDHEIDKRLQLEVRVSAIEKHFGLDKRIAA